MTTKDVRQSPRTGVVVLQQSPKKKKNMGDAIALSDLRNVTRSYAKGTLFIVVTKCAAYSRTHSTHRQASWSKAIRERAPRIDLTSIRLTPCLPCPMRLESRRTRPVCQIFGWKDGGKDTEDTSQRGYISCLSCSGCESHINDGCCSVSFFYLSVCVLPGTGYSPPAGGG